MAQKKCPKCGVPKDTDDFPKDKSKKDGLYPMCKLCRAPKTRAQYAENQPKVRRQQKALYDANPEKFRAASKTFREAHPEYMKTYLAVYYATNGAKLKADRRERYWANVEEERAYRRAYNEANREKVRAGVRDWFKRNPHASKKASYAYRARLAAIPSAENTLTSVEIDAILEFFNYRCGYCLVDLRTLRKGDSTLDHMLPVTRGGANTADNVIPCCRSCNSRKRDRLMVFMATYA